MGLDPAKRLEILQRTTPNKEIVPIFWDRMTPGNGLIGRRGKHITLLLPISIPIPELDYYSIKVIGDGQILDEREGKPDSWLRNHFNHATSIGGGIDGDEASWGDGNINIKDTSGNIKNGARPIAQYFSQNLESNSGYGYYAPVATTSRGIILGTGTTAVSWQNDYSIETLIAHGQSANQLYYATSYVPANDIWDSGSTSRIQEWARYYDNFSGSTITANEMGIYGKLTAGGSGQTHNMMMARDIISPGLAIPYKAQAKIAYRFSLNYTNPSPGNRLRNLYNMMVSQQAALNANDSGGFDNDYLNIKDTGDTIRSGNWPITAVDGSMASTTYGLYAAAAGISAKGCRVGSNDTAVDFDDTNLNTMINHGTSSGELEYSASETPVGNWDSGTKIYTVSQARTFANGSGSNVTVKESGMVGNVYGTAYWYILTCRNTFASVVIADGEDLRVVYQFDTQFPT